MLKWLLGFLLLVSTTSWAESVRLQFERYPDDPSWMNTVQKVFDDFGKLAEVMFVFPHGLTVRFEKINQSNAFYRRSDHSITLGRELVLEAKDTFASSGYSEREAIRRAIDYFVFVYLHELGHAAIGELNIPIVGREEEVVDEFATMIFVIAGKGDFPVAAADYYGIRSETYKQDYFSDTHSLDPQRFASIYAIMYGAEPVTFGFVKGMISPDRCQRASQDFQQKWSSWRALLKPYLRYDAFAKRRPMELELLPRLHR